MNKKSKFGLAFIALLLYSFIFVDRFTAYFNLESGMKTFSNSSLGALFSAILIAPLIEESIFRWPLIRNKFDKYFIYIFLSICILLFIDIYLGIILIFVFSSLVFFKDKLKNENELQFNLFLLFGAVAFSIVHIPVINAPTLSINILMALIAFFPVGLFYSYARIHFGIGISILFHSIDNLLILAINEIIY